MEKKNWWQYTPHGQMGAEVFLSGFYEAALDTKTPVYRLGVRRRVSEGFEKLLLNYVDSTLKAFPVQLVKKVDGICSDDDCDCGCGDYGDTWAWGAGFLSASEDREEDGTQYFSFSGFFQDEAEAEAFRTFVQKNTEPIPKYERPNVLALVVDRCQGLHVETIGSLDSPIIRENYSKVVMDSFDRVTVELLKKKPKGRVLVLDGPPGTGKCLGRGTPVLLADGRVVAVEEIVTGDRLMGPDGTARTVLTTNRGEGPLFQIDPLKGESWVCNDVHILSLVNTDSGEVVDIGLDELAKRSKWFQERHKLFSVGVEHFEGEAAEVPIDPYFLGVWFGDGTKATQMLSRDSDGRGLVRVSVTKEDPEIQELCSDVAKQWGLEVRLDNSGGTRAATWTLVRGTRLGGMVNPLLSEMRKLVGPEVKVPPTYLTAKKEIRQRLLAGWLDADGHLVGTGYEIVQRRRDWADALAFVARSLGLRVTTATKYVKGYAQPYYRMFISGPTDKLPMRIERKKAGPRRQSKDVLRTGFSTKPLGVGEYFGFTLDGDGRFLLGDFTVTHNTYFVRGLMTAMPKLRYLLVPPSLIKDFGSPEMLPVLVQEQRQHRKRPLVCILEDADEVLTSKGRKNIESLSAVLNLGDGILGSTLNVRLILTTNTPIDGIDKALLRPGRLLERIQIGSLNQEEAKSAFDRLVGSGLGLRFSPGPSTLAEVYEKASQFEADHVDTA